MGLEMTQARFVKSLTIDNMNFCPCEEKTTILFIFNLYSWKNRVGRIDQFSIILFLRYLSLAEYGSNKWSK